MKAYGNGNSTNNILLNKTFWLSFIDKIEKKKYKFYILFRLSKIKRKKKRMQKQKIENILLSKIFHFQMQT